MKTAQNSAVGKVATTVAQANKVPMGRPQEDSESSEESSDSEEEEAPAQVRPSTKAGRSLVLPSL